MLKLLVIYMLIGLAVHVSLYKWDVESYRKNFRGMYSLAILFWPVGVIVLVWVWLDQALAYFTNKFL